MKSLDINQIKEYLPHRYPLLLVDRVTDAHLRAGRTLPGHREHFIFDAGRETRRGLVAGEIRVQRIGRERGGGRDDGDGAEELGKQAGLHGHQGLSER